MIDVNKTVVNKLKEINLPVYYENFLDSKSVIPCLSYREYNNYSDKEGNTLGYSRIVMSIKVWGKDMDTLCDYSELVDEKMRELGFKRTNTFDTWLNNIGQRELKYSCLALEDFD